MSYMFLGQQDPRDTMVMSTLCFVQHKVGHGASSVHHLNSFAPLLHIPSTSVHVDPVHLLIQVMFHVILNSCNLAPVPSIFSYASDWILFFCCTFPASNSPTLLRLRNRL